MQYLIIFVIIIALDHVLALFKSDRLKRASMYYTIFLLAAGVCGLVALRAVLYFSLKGRDNLSSDFISWMLGRYDMFVSAAAIFSFIVALGYFAALIFIKKNSGLYRFAPRIIIALCLLNFVLSVVYGLGTINADFDLATFIILSSAFTAAILHAPLLQYRHNIVTINTK